MVVRFMAQFINLKLNKKMGNINLLAAQCTMVERTPISKKSSPVLSLIMEDVQFFYLKH